MRRKRHVLVAASVAAVFVYLTSSVHFRAYSRNYVSTVNEIRYQDFSIANKISLKEKGVEVSSIALSTYNNTSRFAYAFVIGGCYPEKPSYLGFMYNVWISASLIRRVQTRADIILYVQMSFKSRWDVLPETQQSILNHLGIRTIYIPKNPDESFYETVLDKFRILDLTEYQRILLMDADVMPLGNLDYLFEESIRGNLMENYVVMTETEPANGGFFMLTPHTGDWELLQTIVRKRELEAALRTDSRELFDPVEGWGHVIVPPDYWETKTTKGTNWTFGFAYSDQGLLYHWVKYVKKNVSVRRKGQIQHWTTTQNGTLYMANLTHRQLAAFPRPLVVDRYHCLRWGCDWAHFTSDGKPWLHAAPSVVLDNPQHRPRNAIELWFVTLLQLSDEFNLGIDLTDWPMERPTLGTWAGHQQVRTKVYKTLRSSQKLSPDTS